MSSDSSKSSARAKILISACLYGARVRYDGGHKLIEAELFNRWRDEGRLVPICPEEAGGLPTPRAPAERQGERIIDKTGADVTEEFHKGAAACVALARAEGCRFALLKENSPSCGSSFIYDGSFSGKRLAGAGVTAAALRAAGVAVFSENEIEALAAALDQ